MPRNPLNPKLPPKDPVTGRRKRPRNKTKRKIPANSERHKALWQQPEFLAKMKARSALVAEDRKRNPLKYARLHIPDGMTRKMAKPLWDHAYALADKFIQIMKDTGQLPDDEKVDVIDADGEVTVINVPQTDSGKAERALREAFVLAVGPTDHKTKLGAINTVLNFTKSKPETKSKLTLDKAEEFLSMVAGDNGDRA